MSKNVDFLNDIYQNAEMGIIGIRDVLYKVKNEKLIKELIKEKKSFEKIQKRCEKMLKLYKSKPKKINMMTKISSEFFSQMRLNRDNSDEIIIKMMIKVSHKSVGILSAKLMEYDGIDSDVKKIVEKLLENICNNIKQLKKFDKIC